MQLLPELLPTKEAWPDDQLEQGARCFAVGSRQDVCFFLLVSRFPPADNKEMKA